MKAFKEFQNLAIDQPFRLALGLMIGLAAYQFLNGFYTGVIMELAK